MTWSEWWLPGYRLRGYRLFSSRSSSARSGRWVELVGGTPWSRGNRNSSIVGGEGVGK